MLAKLQQRVSARDEQGFTLIELLIVIVIIGILLAIAVPSYLAFRDRAKDSAAKSNVRAAIPAMEACYSDKGAYTDCTATFLKANYDQGLKTEGDSKITITTSASSYCISAQGKDATTHWKKTPTTDITSAAASC